MVSVVALERRLARFTNPIGRCARALLQASRLPAADVDVYVVGDRFAARYLPRLPNHPDGFNVLAYPAPRAFPQPARRGIFLGELFINLEYLARHGEDAAALLAHGLLHLMGYEHGNTRARMEMERRERTLIRAFRLRNRGLGSHAR